jgi:hypothetical protein
VPAGFRWSWYAAFEMRVEEDSKAATLRVWYRPWPDPEQEPLLTLAAPGYRDVELLLPRAAGSASAPIEARFERVGVLEVRVRAPKEYRPTLALQRLDPLARPASPLDRATRQPVYRPAPRAIGETVVWEPLEEGTYVLEDSATGLSTPPVDVVPSRGTAKAVFDLSEVVRVRGRVAAPEDAVDVWLELVRARAGRVPLTLSSGNRFDLWLPRGKGWLLVPAWRESKVPSPEDRLGAGVPIEGPSDDLVLTAR